MNSDFKDLLQVFAAWMAERETAQFVRGGAWRRGAGGPMIRANGKL